MADSISLKRNSKSELQFIYHLEQLSHLDSIYLNITTLPINIIYKQGVI
jgi:hypothetical protein